MKPRDLYRRVLVLLLGAAGCASLMDATSRKPAVPEKTAHRSADADGVESITLTVSDPTAADMTRVRKLAILEVPGGGPMGELLAGTLSGRVASSGRFEAVD